MKFLTFAFAITFILKVYATSHTISEELVLDGEQDKQVRLFKKYALKLVNAASQPLRSNRDIMTGGSECISGIAEGEKANPMDLYLLTMSIADKYYNGLKVIQESLEDASKIKIEVGLMKNIRQILVALDNPVEFFYTPPGDEVFSKYLSKYKKKRCDIAACADSYDNSIESAKSCFKTLRSVNHGENDKFFDRLLAGFGIASALMQDDGKDLHDDVTRKLQWDRLDMIIKRIPKYGLTGYRPSDLKNEMKKFVESLDRDDETDSNGKITSA